MEEIFFLILFFSLPFIWIYFLNLFGISLLRINIPAVLLGFIFLQNYIGYPILFFFLDEYRAQFLQDRDIIWKIFLGTSITITFLIFGLIISHMHYGSLYSTNRKKFFFKLIHLDKRIVRFTIYSFFLLSTGVLIIYILKIGVNNLAFLKVLGLIDQTSDIKQLRSNMGNAFEGKYHWYRLFMHDFLSIVSVSLFGFFLIKKNFLFLIAFFISFFICSFSFLIATQKAPIVFYLISLFFIFILIRYDGQLNLKILLILVTVGLLLVGVIYIFFMGSDNLYVGIKNAFSRITSGQIQSLSHYIRMFPNHVDFLWGKSFPNPGGLIPFEPFFLTKEVHAFAHPHIAEKGIVGSSPSFFWAEMYSNFGYLGVIIPPFFVGYLLYALNKILLKLPITPVNLSIYIWIILHYKKLASTSLSGYLIDINLWIILIFLVLINIISGKGKIKLSS